MGFSAPPSAASESALEGLGLLRGDLRPSQAHAGQSRRPQLLLENAMHAAKVPLSSVAMTGFMLWMSGSSIQIFSVMMLGMSLFNTSKALLGSRTRMFTAHVLTLRLSPL